MKYDFSFAIVGEYLPTLLGALSITLRLSVLCIIFGTLLGFLISLMRVSKSRILKTISTGYVEWVRGTPVLIQLFWIYFCLPILLGIELNSFISSSIALTLYMGATTSETFRSALKGISAEHDDAGVALGLSWYWRARYIIFPQALLIATPALLSNSVSLLKETSLVSAVGMSDLMFVGHNISSLTLRPVEILTSVALLYFLIAFPATLVVTHLESRIRARFGL